MADKSEDVELNREKKKSQNQGSHLKALLKKNLIIQKRNKCATCCEVMTPLVFFFLLLSIRKLIDIQSFEEQAYFSSTDTKLRSQNVFSFKNTPIPYNSSVGNTNQAVYTENLKVVKSNLVKNCYFPTVKGATTFSKYQIALIKQKSEHDSFVNLLNSNIVSQLGWTSKIFNDQDEFDKYVSGVNYARDTQNPPICFGIQIDQDNSSGFHYQLRFNVTFRRDINDFYRTSKPRFIPLKASELNQMKIYAKSGFIAVQNFVDNLVLKKYASDQSKTNKINVNMTSIKVEKHQIDNFSVNIQRSTDFYLVLPLIMMFVRMISRMLTEKEKKIREGMKMMGMSNTSFYLSWIINYAILYFIVAFLMSLLITSQILTSLSFSLLFFLYYMFCLILLFQSIFITVFFTRAKQGVVFGILFFLMQYLLRSFIDQDGITKSTLQFASLSPHTAFVLALNTMLSFETNKKEVNFSNYDIEINNYAISTAYTFVIINLIFWIIISLYLDQVFPNEFGQKKHPLFFIHYFMKKKKVTNYIEGQPKTENQQQNVEEVEQQLKDQEKNNQTVQINDLYKVFENGKVAVNKMSFTMYKDQIFTLLGHNGAGKTTTISILSGLINYTEGNISIFGQNHRDNLEDMRKQLGVCPQHDVLYDDLTVYEHLELFSNFKGCDKSKMHSEIMKMINDLGLMEKKDDLSKTLSGGQKRRLSVGIAFIGNSRFIILDEPTSGMDTSARRHIWEMLKNYKNDRIILLTTHFMDEADNLGDRIAIMSQGQLKCLGSSVYLKNKFGVGYNLIVSKNNQQKSEQIYKFIHQIIPEAIQVSNVSSEEIFQLPLNTVSKFEMLFEKLDESLKTLDIESYGISITTLEEVFLKIAETAHQQEENQKDQNNQKEQQGEVELQENQNKQQQYEQIDIAEKDYDFELSRMSTFGKFINHMKILMWKKLMYSKRDIKGLLLEIVIPCLIILMGCSLLTIQFVNEQPALNMNLSLYSNINKLYYSSLQGSSQYVSELDKMMQQTKQTLSYITPTESNSTKQKILFDDKIFGLKNSKEAIAAAFFDKADGAQNDYDYSIIYNTVYPEAGSVYINLINQAILRNATQNSQFSLKLMNHPMRLTHDLKQAQTSTQGIIASMIFSLGAGFIPASIIVYISKERVSKVKHQQLVSGVSFLSYYLSSYVIDYLKYTVYWLFTVSMIKAYNIDPISIGVNYDAMVFIHFIYGFSMISFVYAFQFLFQSYNTGQVIVFISYIISGTILSIAIFILMFFDSTRPYAEVFATILRLFPPFQYGYAFIMNTSANVLLRLQGFKEPLPNSWDWSNNGQDIVFMAITAFGYFIIIFIIEFIQQSNKFQSLGSSNKKENQEVEQYESDVLNEDQLVQQADPSKYNILVNRLRKKYSTGKVGVQNISLAIEQGEVFGLLGVNGAGKTTTFKMLTGDIVPTQGKAYIRGYDITKEIQQTRQYIGYCPQFDALLELVTVKEHLDLYAGIKCIPQQYRQGQVKCIIDKLNLGQYANTLSKNLSGGNKRKLSVAIAMLGNPPIIFLDEPSTGMDPQARRFMWNVISNVATLKKQSSIVLTTHSMEEAEALSSKMGIMVNGQLQCLGNIQHIKSKYGQGYEVEIKFHIPTFNQVVDFIKSLNNNQMPQINIRIKEDVVVQQLNQLKMEHLMSQIQVGKYGSHLRQEIDNYGSLSINNLYNFIYAEAKGKELLDAIQNNFGDYMVVEHFGMFYRVNLSKEQKLSKIFGFFTQNQEQYMIEQYSIKQCTIEQIFNMFAQNEIGYLLQKKVQEGEENKTTTKEAS